MNRRDDLRDHASVRGGRPSQGFRPPHLGYLMEEVSFTVGRVKGWPWILAWGPARVIRRAFVFVEVLPSDLAIADVRFLESTHQRAEELSEIVVAALFGSNAQPVIADDLDALICVLRRNQIAEAIWNPCASLNLVNFNITARETDEPL